MIEALPARPGGRELLELGERRGDLALVGGAVRDLLLGRTPRELDVTVAGSSPELAEELVSLVGRNGREDSRAARSTVHERFGTAAVEWADGRIDIAERRSESYTRPGALPDVHRPATVEEDFLRRDFTVNAMAVPLGGPRRGKLEAVEWGREDLVAARLRVLHERSFQDDPTRLLRLARYAARLGFTVERQTALLAADAVASGALQTVSGARVAAELWLAVEEERPLDALAALDALGVLAALDLPSPFDRALARDVLAVMPSDGSPAVALMGVVFHAAREVGTDARRAAAVELMDDFEMPADTRERVLAVAFDADALAAGIDVAARPSALRAVLAGQPVEAVAAAAALGARRSADVPTRAASWLHELRRVRLRITGDDLLAAGVPEGPEIGRRLEHVLTLKLDGDLHGGREEELRVALEGPR